MTKFVYDFAEGNKEQKDLLGGKGANLAEMTNLGLPVPPGFVISTDACRAYMADGDLPDGLPAEIEEHLTALEEERGKRLGQADDPLLVAVRSGAATSAASPSGSSAVSIQTRQASVLMMKPGGTGSPMLVISARFAPLPPNRSFWSLLPSAKS